MYKETLIEVTPIAIIALILTVLAIKYYRMPAIKGKKTISVLFTSFLFLSEQSIKNTFDKRLKSFFTKSKSLNIIFYLLLFILVTIYLLMVAI